MWILLIQIENLKGEMINFSLKTSFASKAAKESDLKFGRFDTPVSKLGYTWTDHEV